VVFFLTRLFRLEWERERLRRLYELPLELREE